MKFVFINRTVSQLANLARSASWTAHEQCIDRHGIGKWCFRSTKRKENSLHRHLGHFSWQNIKIYDKIKNNDCLFIEVVTVLFTVHIRNGLQIFPPEMNLWILRNLSSGVRVYTLNGMEWIITAETVWHFSGAPCYGHESGILSLVSFFHASFQLLLPLK